MKVTHLIKRLGGTALVAAALVFSSSANADLVTQLIHFDDASNGWKWYSDVDNNFLFDPTNLQSSIQCADPTQGPSANGICVIESGQTNLPTMIRPEFGPDVDPPGPTPQGPSQGSSSRDPITSGDDLSFTLDAFYFLLTGRGTDSENSITVTGSNGASFDFVLGGTYAGPLATDPVVTFYEGANAGDPAGPLVKLTGYVATFGDLFSDVTSIVWTSSDSAQLRLDCVVATFDGATTESLSSFSGGCGGGTQVPEPGTLALLGIGLFGMGLARRRRKV